MAVRAATAVNLDDRRIRLLHRRNEHRRLRRRCKSERQRDSKNRLHRHDDPLLAHDDDQPAGKSGKADPTRDANLLFFPPRLGARAADGRPPM
jgi:hypothetical protein